MIVREFEAHYEECLFIKTNFSEGEIYLQMTNTGVADVLPG